MQTIVKSGTAAVSNPFLGSRMTYRVAAAPAPASTTAFRQVTTMAKKKGVRIIVTLECTEARAAGATPSRYCTQKVKIQLSPCQCDTTFHSNSKPLTMPRRAATATFMLLQCSNHHNTELLHNHCGSGSAAQVALFAGHSMQLLQSLRAAAANDLWHILSKSLQHS